MKIQFEGDYSRDKWFLKKWNHFFFSTLLEYPPQKKIWIKKDPKKDLISIKEKLGNKNLQLL